MKWFRISRSSLVAIGIAALLLTPIIACGTAQEAATRRHAAGGCLQSGRSVGFRAVGPGPGSANRCSAAGRASRYDRPDG